MGEWKVGRMEGWKIEFDRGQGTGDGQQGGNEERQFLSLLGG
jgi:hypothetical protein